MSHKVIHVPVNRKDRIKFLESMLEMDKREEYSESISQSLKQLFEYKDVAAKIVEFNLPIPTGISAEYCPESDDEGGSYWRMQYFTLHGEDGIDDLYEEATWEETSTWQERDWRTGATSTRTSVYQTSVKDVTRDWIADLLNNEELYELFGDYHVFNVGTGE